MELPPVLIVTLLVSNVIMVATSEKVQPCSPCGFVTAGPRELAVTEQRRFTFQLASSPAQSTHS